MTPLEPPLLSLHTTTAEARELGACASQRGKPPQLKSRCRGKARVAPPPATTRRLGYHSNEDPVQPENKPVVKRREGAICQDGDSRALNKQGSPPFGSSCTNRHPSAAARAVRSENQSRDDLVQRNVKILPPGSPLRGRRSPGEGGHHLSYHPDISERV